MLINHIKIAFRNLLRHKGYSFLNILGLAIGLAFSSLILMYVQYEFSFDQYHSKTDRIYRVYLQDPRLKYLSTDYFSVVPAPLGKAMESDIPEVESSVKFTQGPPGIFRVKGNTFFEDGFFWTEPALFDIFDVPFVLGNPATALSKPFSIVLSQTVAQKFFGKEDPIGKVINVWDQHDMVVTGVFRDIPNNSHFVPSIMSSFETYETTVTDKDQLDWSNSSFRTYVLLREGTNSLSVAEKIPLLLQKYTNTPESGQEPSRRFLLQPLSDVHLYSSHINFGLGREGDIGKISVLSVLALILIITACVNYVNLATARASLRAREVGIRKASGAHRFELVRQFLGESLVTTLCAASLAFLLMELLLSQFSYLVNEEMTHALIMQGRVLLGFVGFVFLISIVAGLYPALVLSAFQPARVLKGSTIGQGRSTFRDILVVAQFTAAIALMITTIVVLDQLDYVNTTDPGYQKDHILVIRLGNDQARNNAFSLKNELQKHPNIEAVTTSTSLPIEVGSATGVTGKDDNGNNVKARTFQLYADRDFLNVYDITLTAGRFFDQESPDEAGNSFVVNQTFTKTFGWNSPIGKTFQRSGKERRIIGEIRDFHLHSFHQPIEPLMISLNDPDWVSYLALRIKPNDIPGTIAFTKQSWSKVCGDFPIDLSFLDERFDRLYREDERLGESVLTFAFLAIFVASLGLFGLAAFTIEQRKKEVGIRKILGASPGRLLTMLSTEFLRLVLLASILGGPLAYYAASRYLEQYSYRIDLTPVPFLLAGMGVVLVSFTAIASQVIKSVRTNPVESLRYE